MAYWQFVLKPNKPSNSTDVVYSGRVVDTNNQLPISGAKITFSINGIPRVSYTDSEGLYQFAITINSRSSGQIRVDADGYQAYTRNITLDGAVGYIEDIRLVHLPPTISFETSLPLVTDTATETPISTTTSTAISTLSLEPISDVADQLVQLVDNYYMRADSAS